MVVSWAKEAMDQQRAQGEQPSVGSPDVVARQMQRPEVQAVQRAEGSGQRGFTPPATQAPGVAQQAQR